MSTVSPYPTPGLSVCPPVTRLATPAHEVSPSPLPGLLPEFRDGDACFMSPTATLHTRGVHAVMPVCDRTDMPGHAVALLDHHAGGRRFVPLIGAIPFSHDAKPRLWIPHDALYAPGRAQRHTPTAIASAPETAPIRAVSRPSPARYIENVRHAIASIDNGALEKVVISRAVTLDLRVDVPRLLGRLSAGNPDAYSFAIPLDDTGSRCLVGSSPELLLSKRGSHVVSNPLAGSIPRSVDPDEDQRRAQALLRSEKDMREHAHVADAVADHLAPWCRTLSVPATPGLRATPTMWHLSTEIHGELRDRDTPSLALALALHPTPAVCGHPTPAARALIEAVEGFERDMFTGVVGWCDASGDGEWAVSIRCAEIGAERATLYAGAGIVSGSDPYAELAETRAKMATMLQAMDLMHLAETLS